MNLVLRMNPGAGTQPEIPGTILWRGRKRGVLCLEQMVDENVLSLRTRHERWAFATGFADNLQGYLECGGKPSMWWTSTIYERHPRVSPNLYPLYKLACLEILLQREAPRTLTVEGGSRRLRRLVRQICAAHGICCRLNPGPLEMRRPQGGLAIIYALTPAPLRALGRLGHWLWQVKSKFLSVPAMPPGKRKTATIVTYFPNIDMDAAREGRFRSRYWNELHDILAAQARAEGAEFARWLFIYFPTPGLDLAQATELRHQFQEKSGSDGGGLSFNFLEEFITPADIVAALWRWFKLVFASIGQQKWFASQCQLEGSRFNFWPLLRWEWGESMRGWRCLERCLFNRAFLRYCRAVGPQRWTLFALENCPWERMLTEAARQVVANGPVIGAQHSTIRPTDFRYFDDANTFVVPACARFQPDLVAANGASAADQWLANGMPRERLRQVEALRYLYLANHRRSEDGSDGQRLLIATSFFPEETEAHLELVRLCMEEGILDDWQLVLKPHPYLLPDAWLEALPQKFAQRLTVSRRPVAEEFQPGTSVWASNSTTVALEAAIYGLPVMVMAATDDFDLCPIQDVPGLARTAEPEDVREGLTRLSPFKLGPDYLNLDTSLPGWRRLLGLESASPSVGM